jgi:hypothetical protein
MIGSCIMAGSTLEFINGGGKMRKSLVFALTLGLVVSAFAGRVEIENGTGSYDIYYVYISGVNDSDWGDDYLGTSEIITPGYMQTFNVHDGDYDIKLVDEDGDEYILWDVPVYGDYYWYVTLDDLGENYASEGYYEGGECAVTVYNDLGSYDIWYIYASPSWSDDWGADMLGSELLYPGDSWTFYLEGDDYYDIYCEDEDGDTYTVWEVWVDYDGFYWSVDLGDID